MGVPITFLDKYNPEQFEIVGFAGGWNGNSPMITKKYPQKQKQINVDGNISIVSKLNDGTPAIKLEYKPKNITFYDIGDGAYYIRTYGRILIKRRHVYENRAETD
ncbi:MAG: adenine-specific methyltransferase EcoRI family protein [Acutalibacteraceae bacterium]|jgi:hypothetical protein